MTAIPDAERRTRYAPVSPTLEFLVNFTIFDSDDVAVFHDGVELDTDEFTVEGTFTNGESTNAKVVAADIAGWSGVTVDIVGRRRPRRVDQFQDGVGVPARDQNLILNTIVAAEREGYDRTLRTLRGPPGETVADMPPADDRAGGVLAFDNNGDPEILGDLTGDRGWSPVLAVVSDGARRVHQIVSYVGGEGTAPTDHINEYVGATGMEALIANGVDLRGAQGASGAGTGDLLAANNGSDFADIPTVRTNLGLGDSAVKNVGTGSTEVAAGDHLHDARYYTEAEVDALISGLASIYEAIGKYTGVDTKTDTYVLALTDIGKLLLMNAATAKQFTIPANATVAWPVNAGVDLGRLGAGAVTIKGATGVTVNGVSAGTVTIPAQYGGATAIKIATNTWFIPNATAV